MQSDNSPPIMSREEKAVFMSRISPEEKYEIRGLIINCIKEATVWRGTPCALASVIGLYALKERGIFKKWGMTSRMLVFGFVPAGVMVITDLLVTPTLPCAERIYQRIGELRNKYSEMDNQPDISFQGQRENFPRTTTAVKHGLTYAQLREANRSGQPLKMEQRQEDGSKFKPKMDEKFPSSSFKPGATYMSGTPIGSPKPNIYGAPVSRPKPKDPGMMDITEPDPPATSDFGFELFPMPSDTDNVDSKGSSKREEGKLRK